MLCHVQLIPWTVARQALLSMGFSRQEYWSGFPFPPPGDLSDSRIKPTSFKSPALSGGFFTTSAPWEAQWTSIQDGCFAVSFVICHLSLLPFLAHSSGLSFV